jgi:hypothetical protein
MQRLITACTVCVTLGVALLPVAGAAGDRFAGRHGSRARVSASAHDIKPPPFLRPYGVFGLPKRSDHVFRRHRPHHHHGHRFPGHAFVAPVWFPSSSFLYGSEPAAATSSPVINVAPVIQVSPTVYVATPAVSAERAPVEVAAVAWPPAPTVVEYATGRYELRGDGMATPYTWVWIPNPPAAPPPSLAEPPGDSSLPEHRGSTYRWTNDEGTTFWTNRPDRIPERFRSRAQVTDNADETP